MDVGFNFFHSLQQLRARKDDQASVSSWNCGIGVTGGYGSAGGSSNSPEIFR